MRNNRRIQARDLRVDVAEQAFAEVHPEHVNNGDENRYANKRPVVTPWPRSCARSSVAALRLSTGVVRLGLFRGGT